MKYEKWKVLLVGLLSLGATVVIGILILNFSLRALDAYERKDLARLADAIALIIKPTQVQSLAGNESDLSNENYQALKRSLIEIRGENEDVRFVYILGLKDDKQFFYVDSEDPSSSDYSYPGQPYDDALEADIKNHKEGNSYTFGPYTDSWGEWVSAYAPVKTADGMVTGMVGLDIAAEDIELRKDLIRSFIFIILGVIVFSILSIMLLAFRTEAAENIP